MGLTRPRAHQLRDTTFKQTCRAISTSNVTLSGGAPTTVDGVSITVDDRILVQGQSAGAENGIYRVSVVGTGSDGTWVRTSDADEAGDITAGMTIMVTEGSTYPDTTWKLTTDDPITVGTTALTFEQASAYAFGQVSAGGTTLTADQVNDLLTVTAGQNIAVTGNAGTDTMTIATTDGITVSGTVQGGTVTDGTASLTGGSLSSAVNGTYSGTVTGGTLTDGTASLTSGSLTSAVNGTFSGTVTGGTITDGTASLTSGSMTSAVDITASGTVTAANHYTGNNGLVRFYDSDGSNYVEFRAQSTVASNLQFKWPAADGTSGQVIQTDGAGTLSFATASGGGGASGFQSSTITTHPAAGGNEDLATGPNDDTAETPFESGAQDAFGVSLGTVYDQMEPIGSTTTVDMGDGEAHVGA